MTRQLYLPFVISALMLTACGGDPSGASSSSSSSSSTSSTSSSSTSSSSSSSTSSSSSSSSSSTSSSSSSSSSSSGAVAKCDPAVSEASRTVAANALDALFVQKNVSAINQYWADPYLQHNPIAQSGVSAFRSIMSSLVTSGSFSYQRLRTFAECDLVVVQGRYSGTGVIFDMFRVKDGKLMEHWDSDGNQASDAGGPSTITDRAATDSNREHVEGLYTLGLIPNRAEASALYFSNSVVVRRAPTRSGASAFFDHITASQIRYTKLHHIIADGNFVFVIAEGTLNGRAYGFYDLFRLESGLIVEHWDSRRVVPSSTASGLGIF